MRFTPSVWARIFGGRELILIGLARISQSFSSRAGQESVKYECAQFLSDYSVLKHIEVDKNEQTLSLPAIGSRSRNKLDKCGLDQLNCLRSSWY